MGGNMQRLFRLSLLVVLLGVITSVVSLAQPQAYVSGRIAPGDVRVFLKDSTYIIDRDLVVGGTLIIEPGTTVLFYPNGRLIDSTGGRIIADGLAEATYNANPRSHTGTAIVPTQFVGTAQNPYGFTGYSDMKYILYGLGYFNYGFGPDNADQAAKVNFSKREKTVHANKYNHMFNVVLDTAKRQLFNLMMDNQNFGPVVPTGQFIVPFEHAIMFLASRMDNNPENDDNLRSRPWTRLGGKSSNIASARISFIGQPVNNFSREWGHIIVLPGARAAFFRNCDFEGMKKDTTVDNDPLYDITSFPGMSQAAYKALNHETLMLTNGSGGAITTFSSRTWLVGCNFTNNTSRFRGGALQILQAPKNIPMVRNFAGEERWYPENKNPNITNLHGNFSEINREFKIHQIDKIDEPSSELLNDTERQHWDDARVAVFLGRMRDLTFNNNKAELVNIDVENIGGVNIVTPQRDEIAKYPQGRLHNDAMGGAIFISANDTAENRRIEIGFGINKSINTEAGVINLGFDEFRMVGNQAINYQQAFSSVGSRGGAIYVGHHTSLIVAGQFRMNEARTPYLIDPNTGANSGFYARGGAIYSANTYGRLTVRGGRERDENTENVLNPTEFINNWAGAGGAIFQDGNSDPTVSPIVGGSDITPLTRDYGHNIKFIENFATSFGGAIYSKRNASIYGSGGVANNELIDYGGKNPVLFEKNEAGYAGGALDLSIPNGVPMTPGQRAVHIVRTIFRDNVVGFKVNGSETDRNIPEIRGGGAIYALHSDLNLIKGVEFRGNKVYNGNGGAICMVNPETTNQRLFVTDVDEIIYDSQDHFIARGYNSTDEVFTFQSDAYPPDSRMMTNFFDNEIEVDEEIIESQSGTGTTQVGKGTLPITSNLYGLSFFDQYKGVTVGLGGTIVKFENGGDKWKQLNYQLKNRIRDVVFTTPLVGFLTGRNEASLAFIMKTVDGGESWNYVWQDDQFNPVYNTVNAIHFSGTQMGWAVGGKGLTLRSVDGGNTWTKHVTGQTNDLNSVFVESTNNIFAVGEMGAIFKSTDGGVNWTGKVSNTINQLNSVVFVNATNGYAAGNFGTFLKTTNAGESWTFANPGTSYNLNAMDFTTPTTGYVAGDFGVLYKTEDAGATWNALTPGTSYSMYDISFPALNIGYIVGDAGLLLQTTNGGATWSKKLPTDLSYIDAERYHQEVMLPENGVGLGGAIYILDSVTTNRVGRIDSMSFNRVRIQNNKAYTGAAIYSDNYDLKMIFNRSLVTGNVAYSEIGSEQNALTGPVEKDASGTILKNLASSDLAGAVFYAEIQGPLPSYLFSEAANSIYDNDARFLIRLPDAPNTKGVLAGTTGIGMGGTDTLRGNYWGLTEVDLDLILPEAHGQGNAVMETFYVATDGKKHLNFVFWENNTDRPANPLLQGPFESRWRFEYNPIPLLNKPGTQNEADVTSIPEKLLFSGHVYDIYDKGTDIKTADYSKRRMSPIEDFAVGIPPVIKRFNDTLQPSYTKYVKRWARDPKCAEARDDQGNLKFPIINELQTEFRNDPETNEPFHPIGYPLFLESHVDYDGLDERSNNDIRAINESVFFVINENTGDFIRINFEQESELAPYNEVFRARVDLVPDSTNRNPDNTIRRTLEGLYNFGTNMGEPRLLQNIRFSGEDPSLPLGFNEDMATLRGRRYHNNKNLFGGFTNWRDLFSNRPDMPAANIKNGINYETYYAGEKYRALPVDTGDIVRIVSRTVLWREGINLAMRDGLSFKIVESTKPPIFTGDIVSLRDDTLRKILPSEYPYSNAEGKLDTINMVQFLNKLWVTEDREYPQRDGWFSGWTKNSPNPRVGVDALGRDSILAVTAVDHNNFYDPRAFVAADKYAYLGYQWRPVFDGTDVFEYTSSLNYWLSSELITAGEDRTGITNPKDSAQGYLVLRGRATNPFVVPGGEELIVEAHNFPPHWRTIDSLKAFGDPFTGEYLDCFINIFPPYLHAPVYSGIEPDSARYLQQDTIDIGRNFASEYRFKIFVADSAPRFLMSDDPNNSYPEVVTVRRDSFNERIDTLGTYVASVTPCRSSSDGRLLANVTNKLRFQVDINTNDELEDQWAEDNPVKIGADFYPWDFRYGRTSYGFYNRAFRPYDRDGQGGDTLIPLEDFKIDSMLYGDLGTVYVKARPIWMDDQFVNVYGDDDQKDQFGVDFTMRGQLNIRIDSSDAQLLLTPVIMNQYHGKLNTDTVFTVVVNDGHGMINSKEYPVMINFEPVILTETLPDAKEDVEYNRTSPQGNQLIDSLRMIKFYDPNFNQDHWFELVYPDYPLDRIPRDPCFPNIEGNYWDLTGLKTAPSWLKINRESGVLYGTPGITDAPQNVTFTVIVWDEDSLSHIKTFTIYVDSTNHKPGLTAAPEASCIDEGGAYVDTVYVFDKDLLRNNDLNVVETLTLEVIQPVGLTIEPSVITGPRTKAEGDTVKVVVFSNDFQAPRDPDGRVTIKIKVTDASGKSYILEYRIKYSDPIDFAVDLLIENNKGGKQWLQWGTGPLATTGDAIAVDGDTLGQLDYNFCEYELPPFPHIDIFDARWEISNKNGVLRNIFPSRQSNPELRVYRGTIQSGGEAGNTSNHYPITITWDRTQVPEKQGVNGQSFFIRDNSSNGNLFNFDMRTGEGLSVFDIEKVDKGDSVKIIIKRASVDGFVIIHDWTSDAEEQPSLLATGITNITPNPATESTKITYTVNAVSDVKVEIIEPTGRIIATLTNGKVSAGTYELNWDGIDMQGNPVASGSYMVKLTANGISSTKQVVIAR